jgi:hypothetical protein
MTKIELARASFMAGQRMANMAFNLRQRDDPPSPDEWQRIREGMKQDQKEWDAGSNELTRLIGE